MVVYCIYFHSKQFYHPSLSKLKCTVFELDLYIHMPIRSSIKDNIVFHIIFSVYFAEFGMPSQLLF